MTDRLSRALRALADALDEVESASKETAQASTAPGPAIAAPTSCSSATSHSAGPTSTASPLSTAKGSLDVPGSVVAKHTDNRIYIVVANPRDPARVGVFVGKWRTLEEALPGARLCDSAVRLRRVESLDEARAIWARAHPSIPMPTLRL